MIQNKTTKFQDYSSNIATESQRTFRCYFLIKKSNS